MSVLFASAEVAPYSKTGGLADVAGALPVALSHHLGSISVITPLYADINRSKYGITPTSRSGHIRMALDTYEYQIWEAWFPDSETQVLFIENEAFYGRSGIYVGQDGQGFQDNNQRFFFFQLVILDLLQRGAIEADLIHCNDHHTGLLPALVRFNKMPVSTLFTIHNFLYHGHFNRSELSLLPGGFGEMLHLTQWDNYSALLNAIDFADQVNTVSPGYARELLQGIDLDVNSHAHVLAAKEKFSGIVNGIDVDYWNPETDPYLKKNYSVDTLDDKQYNKMELLRVSNLDPEGNGPLMGSVSRLVENKGFPLITQVIEPFISQGIRFVFLGSGDPRITEDLKNLSIKYPRQIAFHPGYNEPLAHLIEAGSDMFLMPSRFEPCGLNQLYSLRYGTIPIVNGTGGLADTVQETQDSSLNTGFLMKEYTRQELSMAMDRAIRAFGEPELWKAMMQRGMRQDWSWNHSANEYLKLYLTLGGGAHEII